MAAARRLAAAGASEAKSDHAGVQPPRSSSLSPPSQQPAASDGPKVRRSTASRALPLSQSGGCTGSSTSKGATMPGTRACSAKKLDASTGEMPEATFQVCANSMAARRCLLAPVLSPPPSLPRVSLAYSRPPYSLCAMAPGAPCAPSSPSLRQHASCAACRSRGKRFGTGTSASSTHGRPSA